MGILGLRLCFAESPKIQRSHRTTPKISDTLGPGRL